MCASSRRDPSAHVLPISLRLRGYPALVPSQVAVKARGNDVLGSVAASFAPWHEVLSRALQLGSLTEGEPVGLGEILGHV